MIVLYQNKLEIISSTLMHLRLNRLTRHFKPAIDGARSKRSIKSRFHDITEQRADIKLCF